MPGHRPPGVLGLLAGALAAREPSLGSVRLVAVDGHAGSGKSTFAARLAVALGGAPVLPLDLIASHTAPFDWTERLEEQVLAPLRQGRTAHYAPYDWVARRRLAPVPLPAAPVVLVEGVGAGRRALRPWLAALLWVDVPREPSWRRGRRRDGPGLGAFWDGWTADEVAHFADDPSYPYADLLVRQSREGYAMAPGPGGAAEPD
ncbi:uridine kinase [Streptomyces sp. NPDC058045]|uniref:uridine kinase family protein n=1 Tax=Streptomyces sp. NPDC058045 TaxID=3346311 RepID=UPI0036E44A2D